MFDLLLVEGPKALHRTGLALFRRCLPPRKGGLRMAQGLKWRVARCYDVDELMKVSAWQGMARQGRAASLLMRCQTEH